MRWGLVFHHCFFCCEMWMSMWKQFLHNSLAYAERNVEWSNKNYGTPALPPPIRSWTPRHIDGFKPARNREILLKLSKMTPYLFVQTICHIKRNLLWRSWKRGGVVVHTWLLKYFLKSSSVGACKHTEAPSPALHQKSSLPDLGATECPLFRPSF